MCSGQCKKISLLIVLLTNYIPSIVGSARYYETTVDDISIIYPHDLEQEISDLLFNVKKIRRIIGHSYSRKIHKINITVGHNCIRNARAAPINNVNFINYEYLCSGTSYSTTMVHELRHVVQWDFFFDIILRRKSIFSILSFGSWDYKMLTEGDAVLTETLLTKFGRGRIEENFLLSYKINTLERPYLKYANYLYGSRKYFLSPQTYELGYLFWCYVRRKYGKSILQKIYQRPSLFDGIHWNKHYHNVKILLTNVLYTLYPNTINEIFRDNTGETIPQLFGDMQNELRQQWTKQLENLRLSHYESLAATANDVTYGIPQRYDDETIITTLKTITKQQEKLVLLRDKKVIPIKDFPYKMERNFSYANGYMIWSSDTKSIIPEVGEKSSFKESEKTIYIYDYNKNKLSKIKKYKYCYTPILSRDAKYIAICVASSNSEKKLLIIDRKSKEVKESYQLDKYMKYGRLTWSTDNQRILFMSNSNEKSYINELHNGTIKQIYSSTNSLGTPAANDTYVFFSSNYSGISNIYALNKDGKVYQITSSKYGAYNPCIMNDKLVYNDANINGFDIVKININEKLFTPIEKVIVNKIQHFKELQSQEPLPLEIKHNNSKIPFTHSRYIPVTLSSGKPLSLLVNNGLKLGIQYQLDVKYSDIMHNFPLKSITIHKFVPFLKCYINNKHIITCCTTLKSFNTTCDYQYFFENNIGQSLYKISLGGCVKFTPKTLKNFSPYLKLTHFISQMENKVTLLPIVKPYRKQPCLGYNVVDKCVFYHTLLVKSMIMFVMKYSPWKYKKNEYIPTFIMGFSQGVKIPISQSLESLNDNLYNLILDNIYLKPFIQFPIYDPHNSPNSFTISLKIKIDLSIFDVSTKIKYNNDKFGFFTTLSQHIL